MSTQFTDDTPRAAPLLTRFLEVIKPDHDRLMHSRQALFSRMSHPSSLFDGETYDVDTSRGWFKGLYEGDVVSEGPLQVVGTYLQPGGSWLWGWRNPSVPSSASAEIRAFVESTPALEGLRDCELFQCSEDDATELATWIAVQTGFLSAYPAPHGDAVVHLALKLNTQGAASFEPAAAVWCALCGRWPRQVKHLLKGEHGYVCDLCFQQMRDIMEGNEKYRVTSPGDPAVDGFMVSCICCGEKPPRVFLPYSALCVNCVERAREELAGRPEK